VPAVRALPWLQIVTIARVVLTELGEDIPPRDRRRLAELVRRSKGDPRRLSTAERREVLRILRQVDVPRLSRAVAKAGATTKLLKR
jgi:hypothetical protein